MGSRSANLIARSSEALLRCHRPGLIHRPAEESIVHRRYCRRSRGGGSAAELSWARSGFGPRNVDVAQVYHGFSASVIYGLEGARFHPGPAYRARRRIAAQHLRRQPRHRTRHSLWHIIEGALPASGRAGSRQVKDAVVSFVGAGAPIVNGATRIYAGCGNLKAARANNFQALSCFCQTCRTPILVLVTLPSSSLSDTHK